MRVGIKLWSTNPISYFEEAGFADFVEVMPVSLSDLPKIARIKRTYTAHVPHERFGFNPALEYEKSSALLQQGIAAAKFLKSDELIMHASHYFEEPGEQAVQKAIAMTAKLAKEACFPGLLIENSTVYEVVKDRTRFYIGYSYEQMKELLELSGAGFCLDLEHAAIAASQLGTTFQKQANELLKLKPDYFHLSGAHFTPGERHLGHHLSLFEGEVDKDFAKSVLKKANKQVCLETPIDISQRKREVEFLKK